MHFGQYVFTQIASFLPKRYFERLVAKSNDRTKNWTPSPWSQLLVLMFGQLMGCKGLRELTDITTAHAKKSFHLGFGKTPVNKSTLSKANNLRDYRIFEEFAFHMVFLAQKRRITREFELHGRFYAVDSTTIDLCMSLFAWAKFRSTKSGIKIHTQVDIVTEIEKMSKTDVQELTDEELSLKPLEMEIVISKRNRRKQAIMGMISIDSHVGVETMAEKLDVNEKTIRRDLGELKRDGVIERIGGNFGGEWKILKKKK